MKLLIYRTILEIFIACYILYYIVDINKQDWVGLFNMAKLRGEKDLSLTGDKMIDYNMITIIILYNIKGREDLLFALKTKYLLLSRV